MSSEKVSLMAVTMRWGWASWAVIVRKRVRVTAMMSEAGTPLPDTSPIQKNSFSLRM